MVSRHLTIERVGRVAVIRLSRPPANAICIGFLREMDGSLDAKEVTEADTLELTGHGSFFSAGST